MNCTPAPGREALVAELRERFAFTPTLDELAAVLAIWGSPTRLRILALLDRAGELCVCEMAAILGMSDSAVSQHLGRMRALRLVRSRRDAQTLYYALTDHPVNARVREAAREALAAEP